MDPFSPKPSAIDDELFPTPPPKLYCLRCGAVLDPTGFKSSGQPRCRDCSLSFDPTRPETCATSPAPRYQMTLATLVILVIFSAIVFATLRSTGQTMGLAMFFAIPLSLGMAIGYLTNPRPWLKFGFGIIAASGLVGVLVFMNFSGIFCGLILAAIFVGPVTAGVLFGWGLRVLNNLMTNRRRPLVLVAILGLPFAWDGLERVWPMGVEIAEVRTTAIFDATPRAAWDGIVFYEQVDYPPPLLLRLALPKPIRAEGRNDYVGAEQKCIYDRGYILKQITRRDPPRVLAFDVTSQHVHFEHDVELLDGAFLLDPMPDHRTRVTLVTRYQRLLRPDWLWRPMERAVVRSLHGHVLRGMRSKAEADDSHM